MFTNHEISKKVTRNVARRTRQLQHLMRHCHWFIHDDEFFERRYPEHMSSQRRQRKLTPAHPIESI